MEPWLLRWVELQQLCESPPERQLLWLLCFYIGPEIEAQLPLGRYRVDFAIPSEHIVIEVDGAAYHSSDEQIIYDTKRDIWLKREGWQVLHFTARHVMNWPGRVIEDIQEARTANENMG